MKNRIKYDAPPDPYGVIEINPKTDVEYILRRDNENNLLLPQVRAGGLGQIKGGDWDSPEFRSNVEDSLHSGNMYFVERFEHGKSLKETHRYQYLVEKYKNNVDYKRDGFGSVEDYVTKILKQYDELYENIKNNGYKRGHHGKNKKPGSTQPVQDRL